MNLSLNEVEALAKRAVRGAGYQWGVAEDAAKAIRWLSSQGFDGVEVLAHLLDLDFASSVADHTPSGSQGEWRANADLCPILTGVLLSDCASLLREGPITICDVESPVLLLPFAGNAARRLKACVTVDGQDWSAVTDGDVVSTQGQLPQRSAGITVGMTGSITTARPTSSRLAPDPEALSFLTRLAHRTYAPATEQSRRLGAGAGLSDND
ncbi:MAG: DUF3726 domain-containing protein [Ruegeria sp.]